MEFYDILQNFDIRRAQADASDAQTRSRDLAERVTLLEGQLAKMSVLATALWEIVAEKCNVSEQELRQRAHDVVQRGAAGQGMIDAPTGYCAKCQRKLNVHFKVCVFCGEPVKDTEAPA